MSHKDEGLKTRHRQYWKKIEADSVVLDPGIIAISWEDSTIRLHDGYTIGGRIFPMSPAPSLTVNVLTPLSGNGSVSSPISLNIAALANQVPVLANVPITGTGIIGNPLDIDTVALAAALANAVPVAHDATLVGNGTAGAPLSVNWGLAPAQTVAHNATLSGAGTPASPLAVNPVALANQIAVAAISPIAGNGTTAAPLNLDVIALLPQLHGNVNVITDGTTIAGAGTTANPLVAIPQPASVFTASPLTGNGSAANPVDVNIAVLISEIAAAGGVPVSHDATMLGLGTNGSPLSVNWALAPALNVQHDTSMTGQGTAGNPLSVNWANAPAINVQHDATMTGQGTLASPLSVAPLALANQVPVATGTGLFGNGTAGSPVAINVATLAPLLANQVQIAVSTPLVGLGTAASPLGIVNATGNTRGVVQLATATEGLQPTNDTDPATAAYVNAAIAAIPAEKFLQGLQSYDANTNVMTLLMNDGSTVSVDLTALLNDAVASVPNKHVAATIASAFNSINVLASGTDNQTFTIDTNANLIGIQDAGSYYAGATIEAALQEIGALNAIPKFTLSDLTTGEINLTRIVTGQMLAEFIDMNNAVATNRTGIGVDALVGNTGSSNTALGIAAGRNTVGSNSSTYIGSLAGADTNVIQDSMTAIGAAAGYQTGTGSVSSTFIGTSTGYRSTGGYNSYAGKEAGYNHVGDLNTGIGALTFYQPVANALTRNDRILAGGYYSASELQNSFGSTLLGFYAGFSGENYDFVNGLGYNAVFGSKNIYDCNAVGTDALSNNSDMAFVQALGGFAGMGAYSASHSIYIGQGTGIGHTGVGVTLVGSLIGVPASAPIAATVTLPNLINAPGHGIPVGSRTIVLAGGTTAPAPYSIGQNIPVEAIDANNLRTTSGVTFTSVGVAFTVARYNMPFSNATCLGYLAAPTASDEVRLGNSAVTAVRSSGTYYGAGFTVVSDKRLKTEIEAIPDEAAIAFSKLVNFSTFMRIRDIDAVTRDEDNENQLQFTQKIEIIMRDKKLTNEEKQEKVAKLSEEVVANKKIKKAKRIEDLIFGNRQAGVIAQEIKELAQKLNFGNFLVHKDVDGKFTVDYNSLYAIMIRGFQLRLEKAGI